MTWILAVNWEAISAVGQIVGALAVVISLIYVAREIRSNARAARDASERSMSDRISQIIQQLSSRPELRELYYRGIRDYESLEGADLVGFGVFMLEVFRSNEELYYQLLEGKLDPRLWSGPEAALRGINAYPGVQAWWRLRSHWFSAEYAKHINELQQTAKPPRMYREPMKDE
jgi:hypothetical protein